MTSGGSSTPAEAHVPSPPSERAAWSVAITLGTLGVVLLVAALSGAFGRAGPAVGSATPPPVPAVAATPVPSAAASASVLAGADVRGRRAADARHGRAAPARSRSARAATRARVAAIVAQPSPAQQRLDARRLVDQTQTH